MEKLTGNPIRHINRLEPTPLKEKCISQLEINWSLNIFFNRFLYKQWKDRGVWHAINIPVSQNIFKYFEIRPNCDDFSKSKMVKIAFLCASYAFFSPFRRLKFSVPTASLQLDAGAVTKYNENYQKKKENYRVKISSVQFFPLSCILFSRLPF